MNESVTLAQAIADFHFLRPLWLLALIPALFFFPSPVETGRAGFSLAQGH